MQFAHIELVGWSVCTLYFFYILNVLVTIPDMWSLPEECVHHILTFLVSGRRGAFGTSYEMMRDVTHLRCTSRGAAWGFGWERALPGLGGLRRESRRELDLGVTQNEAHGRYCLTLQDLKEAPLIPRGKRVMVYPLPFVIKAVEAKFGSFLGLERHWRHLERLKEEQARSMRCRTEYLLDRLRANGLPPRLDRRLCADYLEGRVTNHNADSVVRALLEVSFLRAHTRYGDFCNTVRHALRGVGPHLVDVHDTARQMALHDYAMRCGPVPDLTR